MTITVTNAETDGYAYYETPKVTQLEDLGVELEPKNKTQDCACRWSQYNDHVFILQTIGVCPRFLTQGELKCLGSEFILSFYTRLLWLLRARHCAGPRRHTTDKEEKDSPALQSVFQWMWKMI